MFNTSQLYELSFVSPRRSRTKPAIVFTLKAEYLDEVCQRLHTLAQRCQKYADNYCSTEVMFSPLARDIFGNIEFGYGRCGFVIIEDGEARLYIELRGADHAPHSALTISLLATALCLPIEGTHASNQIQQIDIQTRCDSKAHVYGHAVGGYVSSRLRKWLRAEGEKATGEHAPLPPPVVKAMQETWKAVSGTTYRKSREGCGGSISKDGRFLLVCPGNACDLAIYPDQVFRGGSELPVRFSCHNLDTAIQQLTLLAGLAKLCELARSEE